MPKGFIEITVLDKGVERVFLAIRSIESVCICKGFTRILVNDSYYEVRETVDEILKRIEESQDA